MMSCNENKAAPETSGIFVDLPEVINFIKEGNELVGYVTLKNIDPVKIFVYKIKAMSPGKFCVRPDMGRLVPSAKELIRITLLPCLGFRIGAVMTVNSNVVNKDKFVVMSTKIDETHHEISYLEMCQAWEDSSRKVFEQTLVAVHQLMSDVPVPVISSTTNETINNAGDLKNQISQLPNDLYFNENSGIVLDPPRQIIFFKDGKKKMQSHLELRNINSFKIFSYYVNLKQISHEN